MAVNTINGTTGNDLLQGQSLSGSQNLINALAGNDTLIAATTSDTINGAAGNDSISYGTGLTINGARATGGTGADSFFAVGTTLLGAEFKGDNGFDQFNFTAATNITNMSVRGGLGGDTITVQTGVVVAYNTVEATMGQGSDVFTVGTGAALNTVSFYGGQGTDTVTLGGTLTNSTFGGNEGADRVFLQGTSVTFTNSTIGLGKGHDLITNTAAANSIIASGSVNGTLVGGEGQDTVTLGGQSGLSNFAIFGDVASDADSTLGMGDVITISAANNNAANIGGSVFGGAGADTIVFAGALTAAGGGGTGITMDLNGNLGADSISFFGGASFDVGGGNGHDTLIANFEYTAGGIASGLNINGGAGIDDILFTTTGVMTAGTALLGGAGSVLGGFDDAGDQLIIKGIGASTANYSGVNILNTGANTVVTAVGGTNTTGAFVYNATGGFSSIQTTGIVLGDWNFYESGGDTYIQIFNVAQGAAVGTTATIIGSAVSGAQTGAFITWVLSGNVGVIDNNTAGFISIGDVNATFAIATDASRGRSGFTMTLT